MWRTSAVYFDLDSSSDMRGFGGIAALPIDLNSWYMQSGKLSLVHVHFKKNTRRYL